MNTTPQHIEAMKLDPRVVYIGGDYAPVPPQVLSVFAQWLDPSATYLFMAQVIEKLSYWEPCFHAVDDNSGAR